MTRLARREFIATTAATVAGASATALVGCLSASASAVARVDTHTHFYDPTRLQGVPWPEQNDPVLYRPVYPDEFKRLTQPQGITGTVVVEASPWIEDNQWVLDLAARDRFLLGLVGQLKPGRPGFAEDLKRFRRNPLFRGIRIGAWEVKLAPEDRPALRDLRALEEQDLALDVLVNHDQLPLVARLAAAIPGLRIVVDHCANVRVDGRPPPVVWLEGLRACAGPQNVFMKVSGLVEGTGRANGTAPTDPAFYQPTLDAIWESFGEERVLFGSNWPVSARFANYETVWSIVREYFSAKGSNVAQKYFAGNARKVYKWPRR